MPKLTYNETLERINNRLLVSPQNVSSAALRRYVWIAQLSPPGYTPDCMAVCSTKREAIESLLKVADFGDGPPKGMATSLRRHGVHWGRGVVWSIEKAKLGDILPCKVV